MAENTAIEWATHTFNPWHGCVRVSPGCQHCYAETLSKRWGKEIWGVDADRQFMTEKYWGAPVSWNKQAEGREERTYVFCASMSDWLEDRPDLVEPRLRLIKLIEETPNLTWLLLTKRIENIVELTPDTWCDKGAPKNVWIGVTTEDQKRYDERIHRLMAARAMFHGPKVWLSIEPQLGPITLSPIQPVDWAIVGGESGPGCRPFELEWARSLLMQCRASGTAYFLKQLGGHPDKRHNIAQFPIDLRVREFPA